MTDRIAVSLIVAAYSLFDLGYNLEQVKEWISKAEQPTIGYVYADTIPTKLEELKA